jgi:hypothetical protein
MPTVPTPDASGPRPIGESYWVIPGRLLAGKYPGGKNRQERERRLEPLLDAGIDAFLDLTEPGELPPYEGYLPEDTIHVRKPIPDHGVPRDAGSMTDILATLDELLAGGRRVYVHCRAGIGRTGTTVACHLISQGLSPQAALGRLNQLWQQSDRSDTWPEVPETDEQRDFVLAYALPEDPMGAPDVLYAARSVRERFQGALLGLAAGDALAVEPVLAIGRGARRQMGGKCAG